MYTLNSNPGNLPLALSSLVGREQELAQLEPLVLTTRLLTLTGSGGVGKTRLALELGSRVSGEFADGVWFVELAPLSDPSLVPQAVAAVLGLVEQAGRSVVDSLADYLESRELLLILDNCEHLVAACADLLHALLRRCCIDLRILATSREQLGLPGEVAWRAPSLSIPPPLPGPPHPETLLEYEAVRLFVERAKASAPHFVLDALNGDAITQICRRLDGMPLAIELAAARVSVLSPEQIVGRLEDRFNLLSTNHRTAPDRQQTLAATIDWSYAPLPQIEKAVLRRLSVFAGGCTLEAAEAVCADSAIHPGAILDLISRLVDKSLVVSADQHEAHETRYHLLETIRQYAGERLFEAGEKDGVRDRHLEYFFALAERAKPELRRANVVAWLDRMQTEHDNFREALSWALQRAQRGEEGARQAMAFAAALQPFWQIRSHLSEGRSWLESVLVQPFARGPSLERLEALVGAARLAWIWGDPAAGTYLQEGRAVAQELGAAGRRGLACVLIIEGRLLWSFGHPTAARPLCEQSLDLFRQIGDVLGSADALWHLGTVADVAHPAVARDFLEQSLAIYQQHGDLWGSARVLQFLARVSYYSGDLVAARRRYDESLAIDRMLGFIPGVSATLFDLGRTWRFQGDCEAAQVCYSEAAALSQAIGWDPGDDMIHLAFLAVQKGDLPLATSLFRDGLTYYDAQDPGCAGACLIGLAGIATLTAHPRRAARLLGMADGLRERSGTEVGWCDGPDDRREHDRVRAALDPATFATEWAAGRAEETEAAVRYAGGAAAAEVRVPASRVTPLQAAKMQFGGLTARERQVAVLVAQGKSNREVADELVVSERTAEAHITNILAKLEFTSRTQIVAWTIGKGLVTLQAK